MGRRPKVRRCKCCGKKMNPMRLWICEECQAEGRTIPANGKINTAELEAVARERQTLGENPLAGMSMEEISALAWTYRRDGYGSYGKLRGYVHATGRLPERRT